MTGRVIAGRYNLVETIGRGAMGVVWRARDSLLDRDVAIKEVVLNGAISDEERENAYKRTMREARTAARLSHRGVVTVYDVAEEDGRPWIIMELVPSRSLDQVLTSDGPLPPLRACRVGQQLLAALAAAHAAGVLHRDVKPSNVLIASEPDGDRAVLTDFGIAQFAGDPRLTQTGMVMGSPGFTAPERIRGGIATPASDLWSLGATLYAAVEGIGPYEKRGGAITTMSAIINEDAPYASSAGPLAPLIAALLRRNPVARPTAVAASRMFAGVLPLLPALPHPAQRTPTLVSALVPAPSAAGATSQDAVADAPAKPEDASPADTAEDPAAAAGEQPASDEGAGDHAADGQTGDDDDAASEQPAGGEVADSEAAADEPASEDGAGTGTTTDAAEPAAHGDSADHEPAPEDREPAPGDRGPAPESEAGPASETASASAAGPADTAEPATTTKPASTAELAGKEGPESTAEPASEEAPESEVEPAAETTSAREDQPAVLPAAAREPAILPLASAVPPLASAVPPRAPAVPPQAASVGGAGMDLPPAAPSWTWRQTGDARETAWSVRDNRGDPPTKPQPPFGPRPRPVPRPRRRRRRQAAVAATAVLLAAVIGVTIALVTRHSPSASGSTGNTTVVSGNPPDSVKAINNPAAALPSGWSPETVPSSELGTAGGFSIGVPSGWTVRQKNLSTYLDAPDGAQYLDVDLTKHDHADMLAEAEYVERNAFAQGHLPGYHRISLRQVEIRETTGAFWAFTWVTRAGVTMRVDDLLFELQTSSGPQSYAVYFTSPNADFAGSRGLPLLERMLRTFEPVTS
jgi:hypothetical protein